MSCKHSFVSAYGYKFKTALIVDYNTAKNRYDTAITVAIAKRDS